MALNPYLVSSLALLALLAAACVETEFDEEPQLQDSETVARATPSLVDTACRPERQIARSTVAGTCPAVVGWSATPLFEDGSPWLAGQPSNSGTITDDRQWCRYEWTDPVGPDASDVLALHDLPTLAEAGSDCDVVFPQYYSAMASLIGTGMRDHFRDQLGWASTSDLALAGGGDFEDARSEVAVAVIDTMPYAQPLDPRSEHGESMARIVTDIACAGQESCDNITAARILGLPRYAQGTDFARGGHVGSHGDLAAAIMESVERWQLAHNDPRMIINLSVGWEASVFGGDGKIDSAPANAVRTALEIASCHGALIIAAAGNEGGLCDADEALAPGLWEMLPAPDADRCTELGITMAPAGGSYRPLVHAVGGLDLDDSPMPGTRANGRPRLQTAATHAVAGNTFLTPGLTGTSVSAAAVAGAAALVWSFTPNSTADEVMKMIYDSGTDLGADATFQHGTSAQGMHELHVCRALQECEDLSLCPNFLLDCLAAPPPVDLTAQASAVSSATTLPPVKPSFGTAQQCDLVCSDDAYAHGTSSNPNPCETSEPLPLERYVSTQPNSPACPNCTLSGNQVHAALDSIHDLREVDRVVVVLYDEDREQTRFDFGAVPLEVNAITRLDLDGDMMPPTISSAEIAVTFVDANWPTINELIRL